MRVIYIFNENDDLDNSRRIHFEKAESYYGCLYDLSDYIRTQLKYKSVSEETASHLEAVKQIIYDSGFEI